MGSDSLSHFNGKTIWITGASSGIGRSIVRALSNVDCTLVVSSRSSKELEKLASESPVARVQVAAGDLTFKSVNQEICANTEKTLGGLDIAILNAGTCEYVDMERFDSELFRRLIDSNVMSMVYGIEAALPLLKKSDNGQLAGMSSTAAYLGLPRAEAYGATKAAIKNMFEGLRISLMPYNVRASVICPGFVETELTDRNDFPMPAIISAESAAEYILKGIARGQQEIHFPKKFSLILKFIASLPNPLVAKILSRMVR